MGCRVHTQMGTRQDAVGHCWADHCKAAVHGCTQRITWRKLHSTWAVHNSLMAKPNNKKQKPASKGTKAPTKNMVWKKLNTSKWHVSDASDDNTSSSSDEPPPKHSRPVEEISDNKPESNIEVVDEEQVCSLQSLEWM